MKIFLIVCAVAYAIGAVLTFGAVIRSGMPLGFKLLAPLGWPIAWGIILIAAGDQ